MRLLLISGVDITSTARPKPHENPTPDYFILRDTFAPDIIDIRTIAQSNNPFSKLIQNRFGHQWAIAFTALRQLQPYDAVIATGEDVGLRLALLLKAARCRTPLIMTCHNIATRRPTFFLKSLRVGSAIAKFQCLSNSQADILAAQAPMAPDQIQMLYWHVDHDFFKPMPDVPQRSQICSAGMASRDYATLIEAAKTINVDLKIAADSPWFKQKLNISDHSLPPRVEARSYGNYSALRQLYAESQIVVVPLLDVPFSAGYTVILEAMAMGKPVIVTRIKQHDDFIVDGWNGLHVPPGDPVALRSKLNFLLQNSSEAARLGANARSSVQAKYTLRHFAERMSSAVADSIHHRQLSNRS